MKSWSHIVPNIRNTIFNCFYPSVWWFLYALIFCSFVFHLLYNFGVHWQQGFPLFPDLLRSLLCIFRNLFIVFIVVSGREVLHCLSSHEKAAGLSFKNEEGHASDKENSGRVQGNSTSFPDLATRTILVKVPKAVELSTYKHHTRHTCSESRHPDPLDEEER